MKNIVRTILFFFALVPNLGYSQWIISPTGNYCRDEVQELLQQHYGPQAKVSGVTKYGETGFWKIWAKTNLCSGFVVAEFLGDSSVCTQGRYGKSRMLLHAFGHGDCLRVIPGRLNWKY